jgi:hypothetical protein
MNRSDIAAFRTLQCRTLLTGHGLEAGAACQNDIWAMPGYAGGLEKTL